jgi:hypothetical protein
METGRLILTNSRTSITDYFGSHASLQLGHKE